jgi:hypothetical protein
MTYSPGNCTLTGAGKEFQVRASVNLDEGNVDITISHSNGSRSEECSGKISGTEITGTWKRTAGPSGSGRFVMKLIGPVVPRQQQQQQDADPVVCDPTSEDKALAHVKSWIQLMMDRKEGLPKTKAKLAASIAPMCKMRYTMSFHLVQQYLVSIGYISIKREKVTWNITPACKVPPPPGPGAKDWPTAFPEILEQIKLKARVWAASQAKPPALLIGLENGVKQLSAVLLPIDPRVIIDAMVAQNFISIDTAGNVTYNA